MSWFKKFSLWLVPLVFFSVFPILLSAQEEMDKQAMSVTGCLQQGTDKGGYYIMADGKMYEVVSHDVDFAEHVGHTVTVTGHTVKLSEGQESKKETAEKIEAGNSPYVDLHVSSLKVDSKSCSQ